MIKNKIEKLNNKEMSFMENMISKSYFIGALDADYDLDDEKEFKKTHGLTFKQAEEAQEKFINWLNRI